MFFLGGDRVSLHILEYFVEYLQPPPLTNIGTAYLSPSKLKHNRKILQCFSNINDCESMTSIITLQVVWSVCDIHIVNTVEIEVY